MSARPPRHEPMPRSCCTGREAEPAALRKAGPSIAQCPECNGSGAIEGVEPACCGNLSRSGECRGECAVPVQTQEQCSFCDGHGEVPSGFENVTPIPQSKEQRS